MPPVKSTANKYSRDILRGLFAFLELDADLDEILTRVKVYPDSIGAWKTHCTAVNARLAPRAAGDLLIELGYEKVSAWMD